MIHIILSVLTLCGVTGSLAALLLIAEAYFLDYGECEIIINDEKKLKVQGGRSLLTTLADNKLFLPSACGGRGSCGVCKCRVIEGGGPILPTEIPYLSQDEIASNVRLSCQVKVKNPIKIKVSEELLNVKEIFAKVEKITDLTHDIKGLRFSLPEGETIRFKAGQFVNFVAPPYGDVSSPTIRAYSISSPPSDDKHIELVIRYVPDGLCTTYVFKHLKEGDNVRLIGPFGDFYLRNSDREIIFIAGGSGLAPIRSIILDMIDRKIYNRKATFFFGAVGKKDLYYIEDFNKLAKEHSWFKFVPALSGKETDHPYEKGIITDVVAKNYEIMNNHEAYLCGSPGMINACIKMLTSKGMPESLIYYDKFA